MSVVRRLNLWIYIFLKFEYHPWRWYSCLVVLSVCVHCFCLVCPPVTCTLFLNKFVTIPGTVFAVSIFVFDRSFQLTTALSFVTFLHLTDIIQGMEAILLSNTDQCRHCYTIILKRLNASILGGFLTPGVNSWMWGIRLNIIQRHVGLYEVNR